MPVGTLYPSEMQSYSDEHTGRTVVQLTNSQAEDYHLYYYNPSITPDGRHLVFFSERTGLSNLFRLSLPTGEIVQLTDTKPARAEYWPFTFATRGAGACLAAIGAGGREVFYFEGTELYGVHIEDLTQRHLLSLPTTRRPSILNADATGQTLVFATWDEAHFMAGSRGMYADGNAIPDDDFFQETATTLMRVDASSGHAEEVLRLEKFWSNHVLVNPHNRDLMLFTHEFFDASPERMRCDRMWQLNAATGAHGPVPGQLPAEWFMHEYWSHDGTRICFHGGQVAQQESHGFCGWCSADGTGYAKFHHMSSGRGYGHYYLHPDGRTMVTDGEAHPGCISKVTLRAERQTFEILCRHDSYRFEDDQRCHPHPSFSPDGKKVVFTSNRRGSSNVYLTDWE